jgi:cell division protein ZapA
MTNEELIPLNVWLAGRSYRIRIPAAQEEAVRKAVKVADDKISELRNHYAGKDDQDFVAMCLLMYAADSATEKSFNPTLQKDIADIIRKLDTALEK